MKDKIFYFTLHKKLNFSYSFLFTVFLIIFLIIIAILTKQTSDGSTINLLGKQSLYIQKIERDLLTIKHRNGNTQILKEDIQYIDTSFKALKDGGIVSNTTKIKKISDKKVFTQLIILIRLWDEYKSILEYYIQTKDEGLFTSALDKNEKLISETTKITNLMEDSSLQRVSLIRYTMVLGLLIFLIVFLFFKRIIHDFISNLNIFLNSFELGSNGDLSHFVKIKSKDETQKLAIFYNNFIFKLVTVLNQIKIMISKNNESFEILNQKTNETSKTLDKIYDDSKETLNNSLQLSNNYKGMSEEISDIEQFLLKIKNEINIQNKIANEVKDITRNLTDSIYNLKEKSLESQKEISNIKSMINSGEKGIDDFKRWILSVNSSVDEISQMIQSVQKTIEKTSILAMNAAIEAAHAEEYGSGFAVVADEVKKLSEQEEQNISQINSNLEKIQNEVASANESLKGNIDTISSILQTTISFSEFQNFINSQIDSTSKNSEKVIEIVNKLTEFTSNFSNFSNIISKHLDNINSNLFEVKDKIDLNDNYIKNINEEINLIKKSIGSFIEIEYTNKFLIDQLVEMINVFKLPESTDLLNSDKTL